MHTPLMEASMDGHVEVAHLLLDSGAQINMPTDSFESPLTLAACGGHVDLAMLLIEHGANLEEVNDEGYTPLMEAARKGHEEMVALLLNHGANINAQTEETQETALTLACCGGFLEVADFLIKAGADIELGASTPLMEAAQEGHLDLVRYLLESAADVHAQTQTGDTALTYACENGHTDVADLLLQFGADLEHESEGGRTPLMKACRAGHLYTVQFLISKRAEVNRQTTNNDHTPLSLAYAGGHLAVVELLLAQSANPFHKLKNMLSQQQQQQQQQTTEQQTQNLQLTHNTQKSLLRKNLSVTMLDTSLTSTEAQQVRSQSAGEPTTISPTKDNILDKGSGGSTSFSEPNISLIPPLTASTQGVNVTTVEQELQIEGTRSSIVNQSQQQDSSEIETLQNDLPNLSSPSTSYGIDFDEMLSKLPDLSTNNSKDI